MESGEIHFLSHIFSRPWFGPVVTLISLMVAILGLFAFRLARQEAKPCYQCFSQTLIGSKNNQLPADVDVTFRGKHVNRLTKLHLIIWSNRNAVLDGSSILREDPLRVCFSEDIEILSQTVTKNTRDVNGFILQRYKDTDNELSFDFRFLGPGSGAVCEILHNGEAHLPDLRGTMKGFSLGFRRFDNTVDRVFRFPNYVGRRSVIYLFRFSHVLCFW